jgi:enamine deaminase RidA (YjgF/YER057c/UK114 family)
MSSQIDQRLRELNVELPNAAAPVAKFVPCVQTGTTLFVSGQVSSWNGEYRYIGKVGAEVSVDDARQAARLCALNILAQMRAHLGSLDRVVRMVMVQGFVNAVPEFTDHPKVINAASELFLDVFGDAGRHARFALGAGSLPFNVACEIAAVVEVR